jgi:hypothetical protein
MISIKCKNCNLVDHASEPYCRRCGAELAQPKQPFRRGPREKARRGFPYSIIVIGAVIAFFMYIYTGIQNEMSQIEMNEAKRAATTPRSNQPGLTRTQQDKERAGQFKNAIQNAPALASSQKRLAETEKLMKPETASK